MTSLRDGPDPSRRVPAWATGLALATVALAGLIVAVLAGRVGPLVAHPPEIALPTLSLPPRTMPTRPTAPRRAPPEQSDLSGDWLWWVAAVLGGILLIMAVLWLIRALRRPSRIMPPPVGPAGPPVSPSAFALLAEDAEIDVGDERSFDPLRAADDIIASWAALERGAAESGCLRRASSTPTEFLDEAIERFGDAEMDPAARDAADALLGVAPAGARWTDASALLRLYHRARFDSAALAPGAATLARTCARALVERWHRRRRHDDAAATTPAERASPGSHR